MLDQFACFSAGYSELECQQLMLLSSRFGTTTFVIGDVISFLLQSSEGGLMAKEDGENIGKGLVIAGLAVQIVFFGFFILNELRFSMNVHKVSPFYLTVSRKWFFFQHGIASF